MSHLITRYFALDRKVRIHYHSTTVVFFRSARQSRNFTIAALVTFCLSTFFPNKTMQLTRFTSIVSVLAIIGVLIVGIVCSGVFVANCSVGEIVPSVTNSQEIRALMAIRIEHCGNTDMVIFFLGFAYDDKIPEVLTWRNVPWAALLSAFVLSELKSALPAIVVGSIVLALVITRRKKKAVGHSSP